MAKQQKHTARDHPVVPNKKTVAATKEARRGGLKSVKNLEELFKALDEDEAARPELSRGSKSLKMGSAPMCAAASRSK